MNHSFFFDTTKTYLFHSDPGFLRPPRCSPNNVVVQTLTTPPFLFSNSFCRKEMEIEMILPRSNERSARGKGNRTRDLIYGGYRFSTESSSSTSWRRWVNWPSIMRIREPILLSLSLSHRSKCPLTGNGRAVSVTPSHSFIAVRYRYTIPSTPIHARGPLITSINDHPSVPSLRSVLNSFFGRRTDERNFFGR